MADLYLDSSSGDLDISSGDFVLATDGDEARQRIDLAINLNLTEFFSHINYGLPWIKNPDETVVESVRFFLGNNLPNPEIYISTQLDTYLASLPIVDTVESEYSFDRSAREFTYSFTVVTVEGETIEFPPYIQSI